MSHNSSLQHSWLLGGLLLLLVSGCQTIRLPAIDPSGESVLLRDRSTTLVLPEIAQFDRWSCLPKPAFTKPSAVPPCAINPSPGGYVLPTGDCYNGCPINNRLKNRYEDPIKNGTLYVDPVQTVARVGSEVVLRAGLCASDGYLVTKQRIEWTLSQESNGHIVSVGDPSCSILPAAWSGSRKFSNNYAVGRTSSRHETVTRGTASRADDFDVVKGQNWVSVTSPEAGVSHVTVWAPNAENWDRRRATVTIHWVDAEWQFPKPVVGADGQSIRLVTRVKRRSGVGAESMRVRYVIEDDRAKFVGGGYEREVPVNASGEAAVDIVQATDQGGTVRVNVTLIRPATTTSDLPNMILAKGVTTVTWTAPALELKFTAGPEIANREDATIYRFEVSNPGQMSITNAVVDLRIPDGMRFIMATPPAMSIVEPNIRWNLGDLAASEVVQFEVELRAPNSNVTVRVCAEARSDEGLVATDCYDTEVFTSNIQLDVQHEPSVIQGKIVELTINVTNSGPVALMGVTLTASYDKGLHHKFGNAKRSVQKSTPNGGRIEPGQTVILPIRFDANVLGRQCVTIEVVDQTKTHKASNRICIEVQLPSAPPVNADIRIRVLGPNQLIVGDADFYNITVTNPTDVPLTGVKVIQRLPQELALVASNPNATEAQAGTFVWLVGPLGARQSVSIQSRLRATAASPGALVEVSVQSTERAEDHHSMKTRIVAAQVEPDTQPDTPPPVNPDGAARGAASVGANGLRVSIDRLNVFAGVDEPIVFIVRIENRGNRADRDVELKVTLPDHVRIAVVPDSATRPRNGIIRFEPIRTLRAGEKNVEYRIEIRSRVQGELKIEATVTSWRQVTPLVAHQTVSVINRD